MIIITYKGTVTTALLTNVPTIQSVSKLNWRCRCGEAG